jgi:hypothetical protein
MWIALRQPHRIGHDNVHYITNADLIAIEALKIQGQQQISNHRAELPVFIRDR